ncbi:MAG: helix-hairpin-helix domain-containing protein [Acidobacteriota bacterium]|nr:helix-hairpin-helix domain-containing protein [Acidobacteriota bacterium]
MKSSVPTLLRALAALAVVLGALSHPAAVRADDASETAKKVNINQASAAQIAYLPRIGAKAADRIIEYRKAHGPFGKAEELMEVKGVGERRYAELKPYVALSGPTTLAAKVRSTGSGARRGAASKKSASAASASNSVPVGKGR